MEFSQYLFMLRAVPNMQPSFR